MTNSWNHSIWTARYIFSSFDGAYKNFQKFPFGLDKSCSPPWFSLKLSTFLVSCSILGSSRRPCVSAYSFGRYTLRGFLSVYHSTHSQTLYKLTGLIVFNTSWTVPKEHMKDQYTHNVPEELWSLKHIASWITFIRFKILMTFQMLLLLWKQRLLLAVSSLYN